MAGMGYSQYAGIGQSVMGNAELLYGYYASKKNKKQLEEIEKNAPRYTRPEEVKQLLEMYKTQANSNQMPGENQYQQNAQAASASGIQNIQNLTESPTASLGNVAQLYRQEMGAYNNLLSLKDQYHQQNMDKMAQAMSESAKYADQEFEYNVNAPWQRKYQNKINEYVSNRQWMQTGMATWANGVAQFGGGQGNAQAMKEPGGQSSGINSQLMQSDINAAQNSGQGMDNMGDMSSMGGMA
jgi:hypothetical protein